MAMKHCDGCRKDVKEVREVALDFGRGFRIWHNYCNDCIERVRERQEGPKQQTFDFKG